MARWTSENYGCVFAGASNRTADELNVAVILLAMDEGWAPSYADELRTLARGTDGWLDDPVDSQWLSDEALQAQDWLNEHVAPEGYVFEFDDGFFLYPIEDED